MQLLRALPVLIVLCCCPAPLHAGQLIVTPSLALRQEYNDNIYSVASGRRGDFLTTVSPALALSEGSEVATGSLAGGVNELLYLRNSGNDGLGYFVRGSGRYTLTPRLDLSTDLGGTRDSSASSIASNSQVTSSRTLHQDYRVGERYQASELLSSSLSLGFGRDDYDNPVYLGTRHYLGSVEADYDLGRRFPGLTLVQVLSASRDATNLSRVDNLGATIGVTKNLSELWHFSLNAGGRYTHSRFQVAGSPLWASHDQGGAVGNLSLGYADARYSASVTVSHDLSSASGRSGAMQRTGGSLSLGDRFTGRLIGSLGAGYTWNRSGQDQLGSGAIDERYRNLAGSLRYEFFDAPSDLALELSYTYNNTDYRLFGVQMNQNIAMVRLIWQHASTR